MMAVSIGVGQQVQAQSLPARAFQSPPAVQTSPGGEFTVEVTIDVASTRNSVLYSERVPENWAVQPIDNGSASFRSDAMQWFWIEVLPDQDAAIQFKVQIPADADIGNRSLTGSLQFEDGFGSVNPVLVNVQPRNQTDNMGGSGGSQRGFSLPVGPLVLAGTVGLVFLAGLGAYAAPRIRSRVPRSKSSGIEVPRWVTPGEGRSELEVPLSLDPFLPDLHTVDTDHLRSTGLRGGAVILGTIAATAVTLALTSSAGALGALVAPFLILAAAGLSGAAVHRWQGRQFTEPRRTAVVGLLVAGILALTILALLPSQPSNAHVASVWNQAALPVALAGALIVFGILEVQSDEEDHETTDTRSRPRASSGIEELETALDDAYELIDEPPQDPEAIRDAVPGLVSRLESAADTDDELASEAIRVADRLRSTSIDQLLKRAEDQLDLAVREIRAGRDPSGPLNRALEAAELGTDLSPGREVRLEAVGAAASIVESAPPDQVARAVVTELADLSFKTDEAGVVEVAEDRGCRMLAAKLGRSLWDQLAQGEDDVDSRGWSPS